MLDVLRKSVGSWVVKALFILLIISFGIWGVGDYVGGGGNRGVAIEVDGIRIGPQAVREEFNRDVSRLRGMLGPQFTTEEAKRMGLLDRTVQRMASGAVIDATARNLDIAAPDDVVRDSVTRRPEFHNEQHRFDRDKFRRMVANAGYTEDAYMEVVRANLLREQVVAPLQEGATAPKPLVDALYRHRNERRVAETVAIRAADQPLPAAPDEATLAAYHKDHAERFTAPEYRTVTAMVLDAAAFAAQVPVTEAQVREIYDSRADEFHTPERRQALQALFSTREQAERAADLARQGRPLADAAKAAAPGATVMPTGSLARADLPPQVADAVFAQAPGAVGAPVQSPLGWHLFQVTAVEPAKVRPFAEVRGDIERDLRSEKAVDLLYEISGKIEDAIHAGTPLEEVARQFQVSLRQVGPLDGSGKGPDGKSAANVPAMKDFLSTAFATGQGQVSRLVEGDEAYFLVRVDGVTPARLRPLDEVRRDVLAAWTAERRDAAARARAESLARRARDGADLARLAREANLPFAVGKPVARTEQGAGLPAELIAKLFAAAPGEAVMGDGADPGTVVVARVRQVLPADPAKDAAGMARLAGDLQRQLGQEMVSQFTAAQARELDVRIDRRVIDDRF